MHARAMTIIAAFCVLAACAGAPAKPTSQPLPTSAVVAPSPTALDRRAMLMQQAREMDFQLEERKGQSYFCRSTAPIGTHIAKRECINEDTFVELHASFAQNKDAWKLIHNNCGNMGCSGPQPMGK